MPLLICFGFELLVLCVAAIECMFSFIKSTFIYHLQIATFLFKVSGVY